jgi:hypothetical protein
MAKPMVHARSSARRFGGAPHTYLALHDLMDASKRVVADNRHRALSHHIAFTFVVEAILGHGLDNGAGRDVSTRDLAEQHVLEDFAGRYIPTVADYLADLPQQPWMASGLAEDHVTRHADLSSRELGGSAEQHAPIHELLHYARPAAGSWQFRAMTHHTFGIWLCVRAFGDVLTTRDGPVSVAAIAEHHIMRDLGRDSPSATEWLAHLPYREWLNNGRCPPPSARALRNYRRGRGTRRTGRPLAQID